MIKLHPPLLSPLPLHSCFADPYQSTTIPIITLKTIKNDDITLALKIHSTTRQRFVEINGTSCDNAKCLVTTLPALKRRPQLLAHAINYLAQGDLFSLIEAPDTFRKKYRETLAREYEDDCPHGLAGYGLFHVDVITIPRIEGDICTFYVEKNNGVPCRVTCSLNDAIPTKYETLRSSF